VDRRTYPWGEDISCAKANYKNCMEDTTKAGDYTADISPYGLYDMAGNVWEWVNSLYKPYPYVFNDGRENSDDVGDRVARGGMFIAAKFINEARTSNRVYGPPDGASYATGFRCAYGTSP
jgi:iron(II)-dependent oxidoreductase